jgi:ADP-ribose pyrophosphatase
MAEAAGPASAPVLGVGAIVRHGDAVLLVQRARPPYQGEWAVPGGKVRLGETLANAAEREVFEETGVRIQAGAAVYSFEHIEHAADGRVTRHLVVIDLAGEFIAGEPRAGDDAAAAAWVRFDTFATLPLNAITRRALASLFPDEVTPL